MARDGFGQGDADLPIAEGVEVPVVERKGALGRGAAAACSEIEEGPLVCRGPLFGIGDSRTGGLGARVGTKVRIERQESNRNGATPLGCDRLHSVEDPGAFRRRYAGHSGFSGGFVGQQLRLVGQRKEPASKDFIQRDTAHQEASDGGGPGAGTVDAFHIRQQAAIEVVHGDKHDREVGLIGRNGFFKEPSRHSCGVAGLPKVEDFDGGSGLLERRLGGLGDSLMVFDAPPKHGGVPHDDDAGARVGWRGRLGGAESIGIGRDAEVVGFAHAGHAVGLEVGRHAPLTHCIGLVGRRHPCQTRTDLRKPEERRRKDDAQNKAGSAAWRRASHVHHLIRTALLAVLVWIGGPAAQAVSLTVEVATESGALRSDADGTLQARVRWFGVQHEADMVVDGAGVWRASFTGEQARAVGVEVWRTDATPPRRIAQSLEVVPVGDATIGFAMSTGGDDAAWRLSRSVTTPSMRAWQERLGMAAAVWVVVAMMIILTVGRRALAKPERPTDSAGWAPSHELAGWFVVAAIWTWPAARIGGNIVGRHFDALGTVWVIDSAGRLGLDLTDSFSGWPEGVTYSAIDSWLLVLFSWMSRSVDPTAVHSGLAVLGVATSAFAASRFARFMGARTPVHAIAGVLFAGSGLVASAILEGHVYQVVNPWMPWMAMFLVRAAQSDAHWEHGALAGLCFAAALFSSGYMGLSAGIVALGLGGYGLVVAADRRPLLVAAAVGIAVVAVFLQLFSAVATPGEGHATMDTLRMGSLSLNSVGPATAEADRAHHSWALALSATMVALAAVGLRAGARFGGAMMAVAVAAAAVAVGPELALGIAPDEGRIPSILAPLWEIPEARFLRFPGRIMWAVILPLSVMAALGLHAIRSRLGWGAAAWIAGLVVAEVAVTVRLPMRQMERSAAVPLAYQSAQGAVFDLVGEGTSISREADSWLNAILCQYQTQHGRPIGDDCVSVGPDANPRVGLSAWVANRLYEGDVPAVFSRLRELRYSALAVHYDWIAEADALRFRSALRDQQGVSEERQGDGVTVYPISEDTPSRAPVTGAARRFEGPPVVRPFDWPLRVDLLMDRAQERDRYFLSIGAGALQELKDKGSVPGAQYEDGLFTLRQNIAVDADQVMRLIAVDEGVERTLWSGPVTPLDLAEDRLSFRLDDDGNASPMLRSMDIHSPEVRSRRGKIIGLGWATAFGLMGLWWVRIRKDRGAVEAAP